MTIQRPFAYDGECVLDMKSPNTTVTCTLWNDETPKKVGWETEFKGAGKWEFSRTP
jgi:hypothetical protein